jgi:hypothetical protein
VPGGHVDGQSTYKLPLKGRDCQDIRFAESGAVFTDSSLDVASDSQHEDHIHLKRHTCCMKFDHPPRLHQRTCPVEAWAHLLLQFV